MKDGYGYMQKRLKWKESRTVSRIDESIKSKRSVSVMGRFVEAEITIEKN